MNSIRSTTGQILKRFDREVWEMFVLLLTGSGLIGWSIYWLIYFSSRMK